MDAISLDHVVAELLPQVVGRHLSRARLVSSDAVAFEVSGTRERWLWLDGGRGTAGVFLLPREVARRLSTSVAVGASGRARQALLHLRKHLDGVRVGRLERVPGERTLVLAAGESTLVLRLSGPAPALTLARGGIALATLGEGPAAWPPPAPLAEREWDHVDPEAFAAAVDGLVASGRPLVRAVLAACPGLGPSLARETDGTAASFRALRDRLARPEPTLLAPGPADRWHDADLAPANAVLLAPLPLLRPPLVRLETESWLQAAALFLEARRRGVAFDRRRRAALAETRRAVRRLEQLEVNLASDLASLENEDLLRRRGEALLAFGHALPPAAESADLPDPRHPGARLLFGIDARLSPPGNAERLFDRARRVERARRQIALRLRETRSALGEARARESRVLDARDAAELAAPLAGDHEQPVEGSPGPRHYLTTGGLSLLVGRGARENHHLTFRVARPEDLWLHARDVPGAHVILRDNEGRAGAEDLREAAELAAFFSEASASSLVDVHVTRRKHVRPARGGPGRVFVGHSDTLRVAPRDPAGRLRRR